MPHSSESRKWNSCKLATTKEASTQGRPVLLRLITQLAVSLNTFRSQKTDKLFLGAGVRPLFRVA